MDYLTDIVRRALIIARSVMVAQFGISLWRDCHIDKGKKGFISAAAYGDMMGTFLHERAVT
jgi:hypothetical protein